MGDKYKDFPSFNEMLGKIDSEVSAIGTRAASTLNYAISMQSDGKTLAVVGAVLPEIPKNPLVGFTIGTVIAKKQDELLTAIDATNGVAPIAEIAVNGAKRIIEIRQESPGIAGYPGVGFLDQPLRNFDGDVTNDVPVGFTWDDQRTSAGMTIAEAIRAVAAAEKKREREIAEAAAWQREHNRDRQDGGSSSSSSSSSSNSNNGSVHIPPGTPNDVRLPGVSYGGQDADARREGGAHGTPTFDNHADRLGFPIVIDLDGDGVEISPLGGSTARFDYDNDGFKELTAWVGKDDGLLVYDIGNDGLITETREVVIAEWTADKTDTDLDALKAVYFNAGRRGRGANWNSRPSLKAAA